MIHLSRPSAMPSALLPKDTATATATAPADPASFKVAIVGGGIGGLTTALSIARQSPHLQHITVYEQAPAYKEIGAGIGIGVNAARILRRLGVWDAANAISGERNGVHRSCRRYDTGEEIVAVGSMDEDGPEGVRQLSVHRAEILDVLYQELKRNYADRVTLETDMKAIRVEDHGDKVTIHFAHGSNAVTATANLVIACDGIHSAIRGQFAPDRPRYSGRIAYRGLLPLTPALRDSWPYPSYAVSWLGRDKHFLVFPISRNRTLNVVAFVTKPEAALGDDLRESWTSRAPRDELEREFHGWEPTVGRVIRDMEPQPGKWRINDRDLLEQWTYFDGKVVLAGDAAHAMLPHQGSGAGHAIEDAYILGLVLRDYFAAAATTTTTNPLKSYTALYQAVRRPRAQKAQITSREAGEVYEMQGRAFAGLDTYEAGLPVVREKLQSRMKWVWAHDLEADYVAARSVAGLGQSATDQATDPNHPFAMNGEVKNGEVNGAINGEVKHVHGHGQGISVMEVEA
ncbi:hypothetical protein PV04_10505 [Phialophora macrospora]|uniref:FAD-binding domain-containing protein n=1 Tax=Phialophora macrospora TaxID=1851006 RepID=A0A0D2FQN5_9EURO|nr:hypothetical protein PV04_10505 [Phialophora macrospora]